MATTPNKDRVQGEGDYDAGPHSTGGHPITSGETR